MASISTHGPRGSPVNKVRQYHGRNNVVAWQEHQSVHGQGMKENMGRIKEEKAHTQAMPNPKKKRDIKNEDPRTHPRHKS